MGRFHALRWQKSVLTFACCRLQAGLSSPTCGVSAASSCALARGAGQLRTPGRISVIAAGFLAARPIQATRIPADFSTYRPPLPAVHFLLNVTSSSFAPHSLTDSELKRR